MGKNNGRFCFSQLTTPICHAETIFYLFFVRWTILSPGDQSLIQSQRNSQDVILITVHETPAAKNPLGFSAAPRWVWKSDLWRRVSGARCEKSPCCWSLCFSSTLGMPPSQVTPFATNLHAVPLFLAFLGWTNNVAVINRTETQSPRLAEKKQTFFKRCYNRDIIHLIYFDLARIKIWLGGTGNTTHFFKFMYSWFDYFNWQWPAGKICWNAPK